MSKARNSFLLFLVFCFIFYINATSEEININNWISHESIKEIRKIYSDIKSGVKSKKYNIREYNGSDNCGGMSCKTYQFEVRNENSLLQACGYNSYLPYAGYEEVREFYFDKNGILRFSLAISKLNPDKIIRKYYSVEGAIIWYISKEGDKTTKYFSQAKKPSKVYTNQYCNKIKWGN